METFLKIENIKLWARVGVLDEERELIRTTIYFRHIFVD